MVTLWSVTIGCLPHTAVAVFHGHSRGPSIYRPDSCHAITSISCIPLVWFALVKSSYTQATQYPRPRGSAWYDAMRRNRFCESVMRVSTEVLSYMVRKLPRAADALAEQH